MKKVLIFVSPQDSELLIEKVVTYLCKPDTVIVSCEKITPEAIDEELKKLVKKEQYAIRAKNHIINNLRKLLDEK